jgi:site-specific recombinase XerD
MLEDLFKQFDGAFAEPTIKAYQSDFTHFSYWCEQNTISPVEVSPEQLAHYIDQQSQRLANATIRRHVASIGSVLRMSGRRDITKEKPVVLALKRMHRKNGRAQRQAIPLTSNILTDLLAVCGPDSRGQRESAVTY